MMFVIDLKLIIFILVLFAVVLSLTVVILLQRWHAQRQSKPRQITELSHELAVTLLKRQQAFVSQLAHELRTPLTAMLTHLEVSRNPETNSDIRTSSINTAYRETERLTRLVRDMLELYRLETNGDLALLPTNLRLIIEEAIAQVFLQAEQSGIQISLDVVEPIPTILAHPDRLKQALLNLLDNAIKYGRSGDSIMVTLRPMPNGVRCSISDTGPGVAPSDLPLIRQPLYRGRTDIAGSGIGLALVEQILQQHHAQLELSSSTVAGQSGTTCAWNLPLAEEY